MLASDLLDVLVCPKSKAALLYFAEEGFLVCPTSRLRYRIENGVPVMLVDEATELSPNELERLVVRARELGITARGT